MVNYQLGKIYKIIDNTNGNIYIGSTCEPILSRRLACHVANYKQYLKGNYNFVTSFNIIQNDNYDIVLIENCPCDCKDELHKRERYYIETIQCINKIVVGRTHRNDNKVKLKQYQEQYYEDNEDKIKQKWKKYYEDNKDQINQKCNCQCGGKYIHKHKQQHLKTKKHKQYVSSL